MGESEFNAVNITDVLGLSKPLEKFIDVTSKGLGKVYEPVHERRMAKAKAEEIKLISNAIEENVSLPIEYDNKNISINSYDIQELAKRTKQRLIFQELKKQMNIESIMDKAYSLLENEESVSEESVNEDWIGKFFNSIDTISDEDMQDIWSKILAGEIKKPKSYSLRTLDKLKTISQDEAKLFEEICQLALIYRNVIFLPKDMDLLKKYNCTYDKILDLEECGLISANGFTNIVLTFDKKNKQAIRNNLITGIITPKDNNLEKFETGAYTFTNFGIELYSIINNKNSNKEFLIDYLKSLNNQHKNKYIFNAFNIISIHNKESFSYDNQKDLLID